jgi:hypothetical protein
MVLQNVLHSLTITESRAEQSTYSFCFIHLSSLVLGDCVRPAYFTLLRAEREKSMSPGFVSGKLSYPSDVPRRFVCVPLVEMVRCAGRGLDDVIRLAEKVITKKRRREGKARSGKGREGYVEQ